MNQVSPTELAGAERFRRQPGTRRRRARPIIKWLATTARVAVILLPTLALLYWMFTSQVWSFKKVSISGNERIERTVIERHLEAWRGENLLRLDLRSLQKTLGRLAWVRSVEIRKRLPDRLSVRVLERQPSAVWSSGQDRFFLDEKGDLIASAAAESQGAPDQQDGDRQTWLEVRTPVGRAGDGVDQQYDAADRRREAVEMSFWLGERLGPSIGRVVAVTALGQGDYQVEFEGLEFPLVVDEDVEEQKLDWLVKLLPRLVSRFGPLSAIDLRFARRVVLQPESSLRETGSEVG